MKASEGDSRPLEVIHDDVLKEVQANFRRQRHDITTNKGLVAFLDKAINAFVVSDGEIIGREELNTLGYVCGVQLKAIKAVQEEDNPQESIADILKAGGAQMRIDMTPEERKMYLTAGSIENMQRVLQAVKNDGRIVELIPQADGSYAAPPLAQPPKSDAPMPIPAIGAAMRAEGVGITNGEVRTLFGPSLGSPGTDDIEEFGIDIFDVSASDTEALAHRWQQVSIPNDKMPGVVVRRNRCTKCGITTNNTDKFDGEPCEVVGTEDVFRE